MNILSGVYLCWSPYHKASVGPSLPFADVSTPGYPTEHFDLPCV